MQRLSSQHIKIRAMMPGCLLLLAAAALVPLRAQGAERDTLPAFLEQHCTGCHNPQKLKGKINLTPMLAGASQSDPGLLARVIEVITSGEMPPEEKPRPMRCGPRSKGCAKVWMPRVLLRE